MKRILASPGLYVLAALMLLVLDPSPSLAQTGLPREEPRIDIRRTAAAQASPKRQKPILTIRTLAASTNKPVVQVEQPPSRVVTIATDSHIANWDADVETDGLVVEIAPLDSLGNLVPAQAVAEVELFAPQRRDLSLVPMSGGDTLELVERWAQPIEPQQYGSSGVRLRLPFGAIHPELRPDWTASWYGLVHVRLVVPGHGVFDDSRDGVRIRPWAPNRDQLELNTGRRFLPTERLGRTD